MSILPYSPKLKKVINQIETILKENDIAGIVLLHTPGFGEFLARIETEYSAVNFNPTSNEVNFNFQKRHFTSETVRLKAITDTANMIHLLTTMVVEQASIFIYLDELLTKTISAEHTSGGFHPHDKN